ncbi:MAG: ribosomal protein S18-alanine N-acetyltransferase [Deltaproteobacteria bacterium]|nr:ribosomal protein S18-alanine N-acetyltransferase [Deltaproteobacteria bacterium]
MAERNDDRRLAPLKVTLERARGADVPEVLAVERACFPDPWDRLAFERELVNTFSRFLIARDPEGRIAGYIIYWIAGPEFHVLNVAVRPDLRRRGVARLLMNRCLSDAIAEHAEFVALEVRASNTPAKALYRTYGFLIIGTRPKYYRNGEDADVMLLHVRS